MSDNIFNKKNVITIVIIGIIALAVGLIFSFFQTPKYESTAKLLVIINQENSDPYTIARSSDYIAQILTEVVYSHSFINNVMKSDFDLRDELGSDQDKRLKNWKKMVSITNKEDQGIILINVLNADRDQANQFAQAISYLLITKHDSYHGLGNKVSIKVIDAPQASDEIAQPKILQNAILALIAGLIVGFTFVVIFPEQNLFGFWTDKSLSSDETIELIKEQAETTHEDWHKISQANEEVSQENSKNQYYNW